MLSFLYCSMCMPYLCSKTYKLRYFFHIGYNGANYCGWQKHAKVITVQQLIETALSQVFKTPVNGCGRTDAGVHASQDEGMRLQKDFDYWINLCLEFNKKAKSSKTKNKSQ